MIGQDYHLLGSKPWRIKSSDEHVGARTTPLGYAAPLKQKIQCLRATGRQLLPDYKAALQKDFTVSLFQ